MIFKKVKSSVWEMKFNSINDNFPVSIIFWKTNARSTLSNAFLTSKNNAYKGLPCSYTAELISPTNFFYRLQSISPSYKPIFISRNVLNYRRVNSIV